MLVGARAAQGAFGALLAPSALALLSTTFTDPAERELGLPRGTYDVPLHLTDRSLDDENQLTDTFPGPHMHDWLTGAHAPPNDATVGKRILVNGQFAPYLTVRPGKYRLRLLNASTFSAYDLELSNGRPLVQIGTGSALLTSAS